MTRTNLDELESLATAMSAADARLMEIGEGVGGLGIRHPEMLEDWRTWQDSSENSHADTVLGLIAELRAERKRTDEAIEALDARWEHSDHATAKYYRRMRAAERALELAQSAHTETDGGVVTIDVEAFDGGWGTLDQRMAGTILAVIAHYGPKWREASGGDQANEIARALQVGGYRHRPEAPESSAHGFCTCNGENSGGRMCECGIAAHRAEAFAERAQGEPSDAPKHDGRCEGGADCGVESPGRCNCAARAAGGVR